MKVKNIEIRLEELDRMESQILFSVSILSADDHVRLARIKEERAELSFNRILCFKGRGKN